MDLVEVGQLFEALSRGRCATVCLVLLCSTSGFVLRFRTDVLSNVGGVPGDVGTLSEVPISGVPYPRATCSAAVTECGVRGLRTCWR